METCNRLVINYLSDNVFSQEYEWNRHKTRVRTTPPEFDSGAANIRLQCGRGAQRENARSNSELVPQRRIHQKGTL